MATKKKSEPYKSKAIISKITATSRMSVKIKDNFYTIEYAEERLIPDIDGVDIDAEKKLLWDVVNSEVDNQIADIYALYEEKNSRKKK